MKVILDSVGPYPSVIDAHVVDETLARRRFVSLLRSHGHDAKAIHGELMSIGWHEKAAEHAIAEIFDSKSISPQLHGRRVGPDLSRLPSRLDLGDRGASVQVRVHHPDLCLVGDFLSVDECERLIADATPLLRRSLIIRADGVVDENGEEAYSRTSDQANFLPGASELVDTIQQRVSRFTGWPATHMENTQVVRYRPGADFGPHHDFFDPEAHRGLIDREGQRIATLILYLNTPPDGGVTTFTDIELEIYPQRGSAVYFAYPQQSPASLTMHSGAPLGSGEKWIATYFLRDRAISQH